MTFTEFAQLYSAYKMFNQPAQQVQQPIQQPVQQPIQQPIQQVQQPIQQPIQLKSQSMIPVRRFLSRMAV